MSERRGKTRVWFAREAQFTRDEKIETLGHEFGPGGPLVVEEIFALAKLQDEAGTVRVTFTLLGARAFVSARRAKQIAYAAEAIGVLSFVKVDEAGFVAELPNYARWQVTDPTAAERKARSRAKTRGRGDQDVTPAGVTSAVTGRDCHTPTQTGTHTEEDKSSSKRASTIDQDALPDDLPDGLAERVEPVLECLFKIHSLRGGNVPTRRGVGLKLAAYPLRDHLGVAKQCVYWATAGRGLQQNRKDWVAVYGTFLDGSPDATPQRPVSSGHGTKPWSGALRREREARA